MDSKEIIKHIRHFFKTADEKALAEVRAAASVEIEGDISIEEYLGGFGGEYFYTEEDSVQEVKARAPRAGSRASSVRYSK